MRILTSNNAYKHFPRKTWSESECFLDFQEVGTLLVGCLNIIWWCYSNNHSFIFNCLHDISKFPEIFQTIRKRSMISITLYNSWKNEKLLLHNRIIIANLITNFQHVLYLIFLCIVCWSRLRVVLHCWSMFLYTSIIYKLNDLIIPNFKMEHFVIKEKGLIKWKWNNITAYQIGGEFTQQPANSNIYQIDHTSSWYNRSFAAAHQCCIEKHQTIHVSYHICKQNSAEFGTMFKSKIENAYISARDTSYIYVYHIMETKLHLNLKLCYI